MSTIELSNIYNWCDRRCEQCPQSDSCPVFNAPERSLLESLEEALSIATQICREQGIDPDDPAQVPPPPPLPPLERALANAGRQLADAYVAAGGPPVLALLIASKTMRVASGEQMDDERLRAEDTAPNLLLLERLLAEARAALAALVPAPSAELRARVTAADDHLRGFLAPYLAGVPLATRTAIDALAAAGRAPSPFCTRATAATAEPERNASIRFVAARE